MTKVQPNRKLSVRIKIGAIIKYLKCLVRPITVQKIFLNWDLHIMESLKNLFKEIIGLAQPISKIKCQSLKKKLSQQKLSKLMIIQNKKLIKTIKGKVILFQTKN
jgi:hypothetical protein